jgi:hypothetical protein
VRVRKAFVFFAVAAFWVLAALNVLRALGVRFALFAPRPTYTTAVAFVFDRPVALKDWSEKMFRGKTDYAVADAGGEPALRAASKGTSSAIYKEVDVPIHLMPQLEWEWRVARFPSGKKEGAAFDAAETNDFPARLYVIFKGRSIFSSDIIEYLWDDRFPQGTHGRSPHSERVRMLVLRSGAPADPAAWAAEKRDLVADYRLLFGKEPSRDVGALAFMCDSDDTQSESESFVKQITVHLPLAEKGARP